MKSFVSYFFVINVCFLFVVFGSRSLNDEKKIKDFVLTTQDQQLEIHRDKDTAAIAYYNHLASLLGFQDISQIKNVEIRIWFEFESSDSVKVIQIRNIDSVWNAKAIYFKIHFNQKRYATSVNKKEQKNKPRNGWNNLMKRVADYGLYNLKDFSEFPNYHLATGGDAIIVQIAKAGSYKSFAFPSIEANETQNGDVQRVLLVTFLIEREFGYNLF